MDARIVHFPDVTQRNAGYFRRAGIACHSHTTSGNAAARHLCAVARRHSLRLHASTCRPRCRHPSLRTRASYRYFRSTTRLAQGAQRTARRAACLTARQRFSFPRCEYALVQEVQTRRKRNKRPKLCDRANRPQPKMKLPTAMPA